MIDNVRNSITVILLQMINEIPSFPESEIPVVGNVFSFVVTKYPPEWNWKLGKVSSDTGCGGDTICKNKQR